MSIRTRLPSRDVAGATDARTPNGPLGSSATRIALVLGILAAAACSSDKPPDALKIPAVSSLRAASDILIEDVDVREGPPKWINQDRVVGQFVYGIGIQSGSHRSSEDLYLAMHAARRTIVVWLESRGAGAGEPVGLLPPLHIDPNHVQFEKLAHDERANRWYALARLDMNQAASEIQASVAEIEQRMRQDTATLAEDSQASDEERVQAALSLLYDVDRRNQYEALYLAVTSETLATPADLDDTALRQTADDWLAQHGVRVIVEGAEVPGLYEAVTGAMGEVHLRNDEFGRGLVAVRLIESEGFGPNNPYLEIDGTVEMAIEGGGAQSRTTPFHVVSTGASLDEARFRAARSINEEVGRIVRETLRTIGGAGT